MFFARNRLFSVLLKGGEGEGWRGVSGESKLIDLDSVEWKCFKECYLLLVNV